MRPSHRRRRCLVVAALALSVGCGLGPGATQVRARVAAPSSGPSAAASSTSSSGDSLETAASRAGDTGRRIAMSLIGLGFAVAAIVLSFRRDFKEAAGVFAVGIVAVLLATPAGIRLLQDTVNSLFGGQ